MKKGKINKKTLGILSAVVASSVIIGSVCSGVFADKVEQAEPTGQNMDTISSYEANGISTYIGQGYNIVEKDYINAADVQKSVIFNIDESNGKKSIRNTAIAVDKGTTSIKTYNVESNDTSTFIKKCLNEISGGVGVNLEWCGFTQIKPSASFSHQSNKDKKMVNNYIKHVRQMETAYVNWMLDETEYYKYLTDGFKKDVMQMEPLDLFNKYGTHVLTGVKMGGKMELTYQMASDSEEALKSATAKVNLDISGMFDAPKATDKPVPSAAAEESTGAGEDKNKQTAKPTNKPTNKPAPTSAPTAVPKTDGLGYTHNNEQKTTIENVFTTIHTSCYGGNGDDISTVENMKAAFPNWIKNVPTAPAIVGVLGDESLYPVWNLVEFVAANDDSITDDAAEARMKELEEAFNQYGKENFENILEEEVSDTTYKKQVEELEVKPVGVKVNSGFNKEKTISAKRQALHEGYDLGKILVVNAEKRADGTYKYNEETGLQIRYRLDQNTNKLPVGNTDFLSHKINYNSIASGEVAGYGNMFGNHYIRGLGKGCYFVQVTYNDQTTETSSAINFLNKMNKNETTTILDTINMSVLNHGGIDKINIFVTYQTVAMNYIIAPVQDWIVEAELDFK